MFLEQSQLNRLIKVKIYNYTMYSGTLYRQRYCNWNLQSTHLPKLGVQFPLSFLLAAYINWRGSRAGKAEKMGKTGLLSTLMHVWSNRYNVLCLNSQCCIEYIIQTIMYKIRVDSRYILCLTSYTCTLYIIICTCVCSLHTLYVYIYIVY